MKKLLSTVSGAALAVTAAGAFTTSATAQTAQTGAAQGKPSAAGYTPPPVEWTACTNPRLAKAGAQCGMVTVPMDYAKPNGTKIKLAISRIRHKTPDSQYQGIMLVNPGGPGGSGLSLSRLGQWVPKHGGDPYDWIGFDPRGVGSSEPSLSCDGDYFGYNRPKYEPTTPAIESAWLAKAAGYSSKCAAAGGELLDHMKTTDWVQDMDSIRKALGEKQINYYGFSYGTYLGQVYATMYPKNVRRMVWDGVVNPKDAWYAANLNQDVAFDKNMDIFFQWIAKNDAAYHLGTDWRAIKAKWWAIRAQLEKAPADGKIGPSEWTDAYLNAGYYVFGWEDDANAFVAATKGDFGPTTQLYDDANGAGPGSDNTYAVYLSVQCTDTQWPKSWPRVKRDNWATYAKAPFETWANAWYNQPCATWSGKADHHAVNVKDKGVPPVLLIAETHDGATPFPGALEARRIFKDSILIEGVNGSTHSGSLNGVSCTDDRIADYLLTGTLDPRVKGNRSDVQCDPVPQPEPEPTAAPTTSLSGGGSGSARAELREVIENAQPVG